MESVTPKKHLGQHFLIDLNIAKKISDTLTYENYENVLEIGPGMGVLTQFIIQKKIPHVVEVDNESIEYLKKKFPQLQGKIIQENFLTLDIKKVFSKQLAVIGNFPYNISSQIVFKIIKHRAQIPFFSGMFQKEVAKRICESSGSKKYGILSVLCQLYYKTSYAFSVPSSVFKPKPNVESGVIKMIRKENFLLNCDETLLFNIVKISFQQRRKTLRNSLKTLTLPKNLTEDSIFDKRPESLNCDAFVKLTNMIDNVKLSS
tara:strand:+ start:7611 stop:8390 length:780 start_codon:yes stop_codon:yes gene_type:complete